MSDLTIEILAALKNEGGSATTSELSSLTGADSNKVKYRYRKLAEKYGLVNIDRQGTYDNGVSLPNIVSLTDTCREIVKEMNLADFHAGESGNERPTKARLDELERDLTVLENHVGDDVQDRLNQHEAVIQALVTIIVKIDDVSMNDLPGNDVVRDAVMGDN
ncbi:hypothetical protein ACFO0N_01100 [Halobium salinum]|uniref:Uncharacterized protein n=1 Tax=Halobium salinum TaxID=1364940 RepID=A0ABD5P7R5_9EURY|nr:hypothetical protein [Halobium salinum]